jgi:predicted lipoprotein with Yx(FWY)xxD motif
MTKALLLTASSLFASSLVFAAAQATAPQMKEGALVNEKGMTLYVFDNDKTPGKSACNGDCAKNWPALIAAGEQKATGDYSVISRDDGTKQWAYKGKPVYLWAKDQKPGDKTGDGFKNMWHVAK